MTVDTITVTRTDDVARITIRRKDEYNALDRMTARELANTTGRLIEEDDVRCLVLTGTGGTFCTGADLNTLDGTAADGKQLRALATSLHTAVRNLAMARKPVVIGVNGVAAGGGLGLALCGDVVLAHHDATFEFAYPRIGLSGDGGATYFLPRLVGLRRAQELTLLDEPVDAEQAVADGLVTSVPNDFETRLADVATHLAEGPTLAHAATKQLLRRSTHRSLGAHLTAETDRITSLTRSADFATGLAAFQEDREPSFEGT